MSSVTGHFDDMRLLKETPSPPLQCEGDAISGSEVRKEETPLLVLRCARKDNNQCDWHFFYRSGDTLVCYRSHCIGASSFLPHATAHTWTAFSPRKTRSMPKARKSDTQKKVRAAKAGKESRGASPEDSIQVIPHLRSLSACPKFPEYDLANNDKMDEDTEPRDEKRIFAKYETLFRPHCGGPPYILDVDGTADQLETIHPSIGTDVVEPKEYRLRPATW
ncbi:hypothetical protein EDD18DRAFT_1383261 [Armillaria luteobubalina]|uniref:Uncharacterized protein n=1 Tax=Armillaria luteobubalina TaxID=153913 RepID=A0AA39P2X6_9AGAR|nr:hypothetical protein EDD18DRAFT_1383261 [Armillaria luteobubalina]